MLVSMAGVWADPEEPAPTPPEEESGPAAASAIEAGVTVRRASFS